MSFPWNITNPGVLLAGLLTSEEKQFVVDLFELSYANGDILYYNTGQLQRLPVSTDGLYLKLVSGLPTWAAGGGGGGGYTLLSEFIDETPWRMFYSNTSGDVTALAFGSSGTVLQSNGASAAPTWVTPSSSSVTKVGTPVNNQVGVWTGDGTIEGDPNLTFDTTTDTLATSIVTVTDVAYDATTWNGSTAVPTQNAIRDKIESLNLRTEFFVAASDATAREIARADYACDGTADEVQINLALAAVKAVGGKVVLSTGTFNCAAPIALAGNTANSVGNKETLFVGSGIDATILNMASGQNGINITNEPKYEIGFLTIRVAGTANGINQVAGTERGNWQSHVHDIFIETDYTTHNSASWGIKMESPFRMRFTNVEMNGVANGVWLQAHTNSFNPGNLSIDRMFIDLWDNASVASAVGFRLSLLNTTSTGVMNLVTVNRLDIAGGTNLTGSVGIDIVGASASYGDTRHISFTNLNLEDVKTAIKHTRGRDCTYRDLNYIRVLSGGTIIDLDSNSHNNFFENLYAVAQGASQTFNLIVDANGSSNLPNSLKRVDGYQPATVTINATLASNTILEQIDLSGGSPTVSATITNRNNTRTFQDVLVTDEAYGAGWNGSLEVPTKNAVYDKIETIGGGSPGGSTTQVQYNNAGALAGMTGITTSGTFATLTEPRFADLGFIADANGNEMLVMDTVTSAVNELRIANAATGGRPLLVAQGGDTDVDLALQAKGSGSIIMLSQVASTTDRVTFGGGIQVNGSFIALASASTLNWNSGNAVITHSSGVLDVTTGDLQVSTAGTNADSVLTRTGTQTVTNKRQQPRTASSTTASTLSPDLSSANVYYRTTQTATLTIDAPTGTPVIGETLMIYVDSAGAQTLTINATYKAFGAAFPATTTAGKTFMMSAQYNGTDWKTLWATAV